MMGEPVGAEEVVPMDVDSTHSWVAAIILYK